MFSSRLALVLVAAVLAAGRAPADDKPNPIVEKVKASLKDPDRPFTMLVRLRVKDDAGDKLEAAFAKPLRETRKEKGNLAYDLNREPKSPTHYLVYERWKNLAALEAHLKSEYIAALLAELGGFLEEPAVVQIFVPVGDERP